MHDREALERLLCEESLSDFVRRGWRYVDPAEYRHNWHIDAVCDHLQAVSAGQIRRLIIMLPPRRMKSLTVSVFWPAWTWAQNPDVDNLGHGRTIRPGSWLGAGTRFLFASYASALSVRDSVKCRRLIDGPWYRRHWGDRVAFAPDQNTKSRYENLRGGARFATSVDGALTGEGGDIIAVDDPHNVREAESEAVREAVLTWWSEAMSTRLNDANTGAKVIIMQRVHERDLVGHVLAREMGWDILCLPERYETDHPTPVRSSIGFIDPRKEGDLLWPERFSERSFEEQWRDLGSYAAAGQLQQRPAPREGGLFKRHWFEVVEAVPANAKRSIRAWDLAATEASAGSNPAWTVGLKLSQTPDNVFYIEDIVRLRGSPGKVEEAILATATQDGRQVPISLPQDPGQSGKAQVGYLIRRLAGFPVRATPESGDKLTRATPVSAQAEAGNIKLVKADWNSVFLDEAGLFPNSAYKDQIDALSRAFMTLTTAGGVTPQVRHYSYGYGRR